MKKPDKREMLNLFFSAFLVIAFIICAHFFSDFAQTLSTVTGSIVTVVVYAVFGLLLFYATRVGDGKAIKRFSPFTLIVLVIPSLYIIVASIASGMPLHSVFVSESGTIGMIASLAAVAFGYGVPYTFLSGYETVDEEAASAQESEKSKPIHGGVEADLMLEQEEISAESEESESLSDNDLNVVEGEDEEAEEAEV